uniref:uncharacterized protein LOC122608270 n=1 Tax=Erigeron canadensis TaxID=72917 RepID=UPI001CB95601|nr:uncharacterized protein LOC122608270 [Erigeron canadensis]
MEFLDDLWGPPNFEATEDIYPLIPYSVAYDMEKEAAINEKCCIQVLRILISKADTDIIELEEELLDLLSQLACTDEEFLDMFYTSLRAKLDHLVFSTRSLETGAGNVLPTTEEPVESIYDMLKALFFRLPQKKDHQASAANSSLKKKQTGSYSNANQMEMRKRAFITPFEEDSISQAIVKVETEDASYPCPTPFSIYSNQMEMSKSAFITPSEKDSISQAIVKVETEDASYPCPTPLSKYSNQSCRGSMECMNKESNMVQIKSPEMTKDMIKNKFPECNYQKQSIEIQASMKHPLQMVKSQTETDEESIGSTSLCLVESPQEPDANQNFNRELGFPLSNSNAEDHQKQIVPVSESQYSAKTYKRRQRLGSPLARESSPCLHKEPIPLCILGLDVVDRHDMDDYTVDELKDIARQHKIKGVYKLRKAEIASILGIKVTNGKRKVKRNETVLQIKGAP